MATKESYTDLRNHKIDKEFMKGLITPKNYALKEGVTPKCIYGRIKAGVLDYCVIDGVIFVVQEKK
jgi:hypothetical protein